ncbi:hypothetical protein CFHF_02645 [Caulobacter flavus]|jgi:hypothetical protein|uniref:Uncharacterized protein n=1 Tax=Caulobacter flavus TaxID=1679497 RepID=A0A2N5D224_9CAUL|nr:hypothetical protein [Caulobacter flavus]AYV46776.1 hypothetical protein C1707_11125 [Caulobacter flavus]PLR20082.1 hypothetical protein CFHF_02645 [Caulobacter flavus]
MTHKRRRPLPKRPHRKRGLAPSSGPSTALAEARLRLDERLEAARAALRIERLRASATDPAGQALLEVAEMWSTVYGDR